MIEHHFFCAPQGACHDQPLDMKIDTVGKVTDIKIVPEVFDIY
jgi:hypothetical protein